MRPSFGTTFFFLRRCSRTTINYEINMQQNNKKKSDIPKEFIASVLKHDAFRKGVAAATAGTLFAIASVAIFGSPEAS